MGKLFDLQETTPKEDWPTLIPLDMPKLPSLEAKYLPCWAGDFATALATATETPVELAVGMILATCATATARRLKVNVKTGYFEPCNLWMITALPSGNRKSAVQSAVTAPLSEWEQEQYHLIEPKIKQICSERKTLEARIKAMRGQISKVKDTMKISNMTNRIAEMESSLPNIPVQPKLWTSDATPEHLGVLLAEHDECMAWLSSEGGLFDLLQGRYSRGVPNLDLVLKAHSGDPDRVDRSCREAVLLRNPRLSIGLSPQPEVLQELANKKELRRRGILGRFLYLLPLSPLGHRIFDVEPVSEVISRAYYSGIKTMLDWPAMDSTTGDGRYTLTLSPEALDVYREFFMLIEKGMRVGNSLAYCTDWAGKAPGALVRIAGVLHAIKHAHGQPWEAVITADTMNDASEIMAVISHHSLALLNSMHEHATLANAKTVWAWVQRNSHREFSARDCFNSLRRSFTSMTRINETLDTLQEYGYIKLIHPPQKGLGRPASAQVIVRPDVKDD